MPTRGKPALATGYQVAGTRGHALEQGARELKIHGRYIPVLAEVVSIRGFSAHADAGQMVDWLHMSPSPRSAFVVHGEPASCHALADRIHAQLGWTAVVPRFAERVSVD